MCPDRLVTIANIVNVGNCVNVVRVVYGVNIFAHVKVVNVVDDVVC